jgi:hypothetical protein
MVADEAHRIASHADACFATMLNDDQIQIEKRLFLTATPKIYSPATRSAMEKHDLKICSMDDEHLFGGVAYRLSFSEAISKGLLTNYRVLVLGATEQGFHEMVRERFFIGVNDLWDCIDAQLLAGLVATLKLMTEYKASRVISFHNRVARAEDFAQKLQRLSDHASLSTKSDKIKAKHVSGEMSTFKRKTVLKQLQDLDLANKMLVSNARCLSEGIDIPALDAVAFIDPRSSHTDIIQSVGRAIRLSETKKEAFILLPILLEDGQDSETQLESSKFGPLWDVLRALRAHDETLGNEIDSLRIKLGKDGSLGNARLSRLTLDLSTTKINIQAFNDALHLAAVEESSSSFHEWCGLYHRFYERERHGLIPQRHLENGKPLGVWVNNLRRRHKKKLIDKQQAATVEALPGWIWTPLNVGWGRGLNVLKRFTQNHGHCNFTCTTIYEGFSLGAWASDQRERHGLGLLDENRIHQLQEIDGWEWKPRLTNWNAGFELLRQYQKKHGSCLVPGKHKEEGFGLGDWVAEQRQAHKDGRLSEEKIRVLESIPGWQWTILDLTWNSKFRLLNEFFEEYKHCRVPTDCVYQNVKLGSWCVDQRKSYKKDKLSTDRVKLLESLPGWVWDQDDADWNNTAALLEAYVLETGTVQVPQAQKFRGFGLGHWLWRQRRNCREGKLSEGRSARLQKILGESWFCQLRKTSS